jgi:hypothetical protein
MEGTPSEIKTANGALALGRSNRSLRLNVRSMFRLIAHPPSKIKQINIHACA